jgi:polysaccharide biosynthesis/export protein
MYRWKCLLSSAVVLALVYPSISWAEGLLPAEQPASYSAVSTLQKPLNPVLKGRVQTLDSKYTLAPGDTISMSVYGVPEYEQKDLTIRPDGYVTVNPVGEIDAAGKDVQALSQAISEKLSRYVKNPDVAVSVTKFHPAIVYILGAVQKPGAYEIHGDIDRPDSSSTLLARGRLSVSNLIANAGGITQDADVQHVAVKHNNTQGEQSVDLAKMLRDGDTSQDVMVQSGDTIYVPEMADGQHLDDKTYKLLTQSALSPGQITVRVLGKVNTPGVYELPAKSPGINSAIASAHGYILEANEHKVRVYRMDREGQLSEVSVNPKETDFTLHDNDVVVVDERSTPIAGRGLDYAVRAVNPFLTFGNFANAVMDLIKPARRFPFGR